MSACCHCYSAHCHAVDYSWGFCMHNLPRYSRAIAKALIKVCLLASTSWSYKPSIVRLQSCPCGCIQLEPLNIDHGNPSESLLLASIVPYRKFSFIAKNGFSMYGRHRFVLAFQYNSVPTTHAKTMLTVDYACTHVVVLTQ